MRFPQTALLVLVTLSASFLGCDKIKEKLGAAGDPKDASVATAASAARKASPSSIEDACEYLPPATLARVVPELADKNFEVDDTLERLRAMGKGGEPPPRKTQSDYRVMKTRLGSGRLCTYNWPKPDAAEIRARNTAKSRQVVAKTLNGSGKAGGLAGGLMAGLSTMESESSSVSLSFVSGKPSATDAAARADYDARMKRLKEGMDGKDMADATQIKDPAIAKQLASMKVPADDTLVDVSGVGDAATWSSKNNTLHVLDGKFSFTISVDTPAAKNKEHAVTFAKSVIDAL